jgi:hypothetical protein
MVPLVHNLPRPWDGDYQNVGDESTATWLAGMPRSDSDYQSYRYPNVPLSCMLRGPKSVMWSGTLVSDD